MTGEERDLFEKLFSKVNESAICVARLDENLKALKESSAQQATGLQNLFANGCSRRDEHERRLLAVEARPEKVLGIAVSASAIISALIGFLMYIFKTK